MSDEQREEQPQGGPHCEGCGRPLLHPHRLDDGQGGTIVLGRVCARKAR